MSSVPTRLARPGIDRLEGVPGDRQRDERASLGRRPELIGRGTAVGYTGAYREQGGVDIEEVVAVQTARGPSGR